MPLCMGYHLAVGVLPIGITRERRLNPPGPDFPWGGGICPCLVPWRDTCPCWLSPTNGDLESTQILTRHCGAKSQTISQPVNTGTLLIRQVLIVQPLWVIEAPADSVRAYAASPFDNSDGFEGLHKSSAQTKAVHMELSLSLSFQLSRSLEGYTVGTTMGF
jgi:hypothetical protein